MGYMRHHTIIVSSWKADLLIEAHKKAQEIFQHFFELISPIVYSMVNGYGSFFIAPDGSKEGWGISDEGDCFRNEFIAWLDSQRYDDGSTSLKWVELQYGDDEGGTKILRHSEEKGGSMAAKKPVTKKKPVKKIAKKK